jgi:hypothetical protein
MTEKQFFRIFRKKSVSLFGKDVSGSAKKTKTF